ncbi:MULTISPECIES: hypothetical protein [unclassified Chamaesiphon]|uniref:hypothetical protein n=1 Tax=unclassified Chamaesiphon TaxID=2620921 RepID=UPI00286D291D|nr:MULTISPECIES: hypothetical protein [unclassified Chamaesiphon]
MTSERALRANVDGGKCLVSLDRRETRRAGAAAYRLINKFTFISSRSPESIVDLSI